MRPYLGSDEITELTICYRFILEYKTTTTTTTTTTTIVTAASIFSNSSHAWYRQQCGNESDCLCFTVCEFDFF
jgi:hypothetical protein